MFFRQIHNASMLESRQTSYRSGSVVGKTAGSDVMRRLEVDEGPCDREVRARIYPYVKRGIDVGLSLGLLFVLSPVLAIGALRLRTKSRTGILLRRPKVGRSCRVFNEYSFITKSRLLCKLPILFNVLKGDLSLVGPRAAIPGEMCVNYLREPRARKRNSVRPGLVCDWWIRRRISLDYVDEFALDLRYVETLTFRRDMGIVLRALPGLITSFIWGDDPPTYSSAIRILDVRIDNIPMESALDRVVEMLDGDRPQHACFINPHNINQTFHVPEYRRVLDDAALVLADGFGTKLAGKILKQPLRQNLCGTDLFPRLCARLAGSGKSIYLLGGCPGVAERVAEWVNDHYPSVIIRGCAHGYFTSEEEPEVVRKIAQAGADLLVVGMGVPKQEIWCDKHLDELNVKVAMGFGGLFDYFSGRIPRAPQWVREMGMEWIYRLIQEPRRMWRRYLIGNVVFLTRVFRDRVNSHPNAAPLRDAEPEG